MKVLAFGEILWDVIEGNEHLGGAPFNFAAHSAQCGNESYIVSRLGVDPLGIRAYNQCKSHGVGQAFIQWDEKYPTGTVNVTLTNGQPDYVIHEDVAYDFINGAPIVPGIKNLQPDVFYFGSLAQRKEVSATALDLLIANLDCKYIFYDVNLRKSGYSELIIRNSLKVCNVFKLNNEELPVISKILTGKAMVMEEFMRTLSHMFPKMRLIIVTAAEKGCYLFEVGKGLVSVPGVPVKVADAVGAGDAFSAAFMHMLGNYGDPLVAARVANRVGAFVASQHGPIPEYPAGIKDMLDGKVKVTG
ncbi:MAG TPA: PfkB family carbohydrate kinase [Chryseosolibacter sp.]